MGFGFCRGFLYQMISGSLCVIRLHGFWKISAYFISNSSGRKYMTTNLFCGLRKIWFCLLIWLLDGSGARSTIQPVVVVVVVVVSFLCFHLYIDCI